MRKKPLSLRVQKAQTHDKTCKKIIFLHVKAQKHYQACKANPFFFSRPEGEKALQSMQKKLFLSLHVQKARAPAIVVVQIELNTRKPMTELAHYSHAGNAEKVTHEEL